MISMLSDKLDENLQAFLDGYRDNVYNGWYLGVVVDNSSDPDTIGRCKCRVYGVYTNQISDSDIPYAMPCYEVLQFGFTIPDVGSEVLVRFVDGDPYRPEYIIRQTPTGIPDELKSDSVIGASYPDVLILQQTPFSIMTMNRKTGALHYKHKLLGEYTIKVGEKVEIEIKGDVDVKDYRTFTMGGRAIPDPNGNGFMCAVGICPAFGIPHVGNKAVKLK